MVAAAAAGGIIGGGVNSLISYGLNAMAASKAHDRSKNMMTRGYLYTQEGLEKAGLNRILAVGGGISGGNLAGSAKMAHAASSGSSRNAVLDALSASNLEANTAKQTAEGRIADADALVAEENMRYRMSPVGMENYNRLRTNESLPDNIPGIVSKGIFGTQSSAQKMWQQHSPNFMPAIRDALRKGHRKPRKPGQWNFDMIPPPGQRPRKK